PGAKPVVIAFSQSIAHVARSESHTSCRVETSFGQWWPYFQATMSPVSLLPDPVVTSVQSSVIGPRPSQPLPLPQFRTERECPSHRILQTRRPTCLIIGGDDGRQRIEL